MKTKTVNVLGTQYTINIIPESHDVNLDDSFGYTDPSVGKIVIDDYTEYAKNHPNSSMTLQSNMESVINRTIRHELIHAFMFESGLTRSSTNIAWAHDESLVEWLATQLPKIVQVMQQVDVLEIGIYKKKGTKTE